MSHMLFMSFDDSSFTNLHNTLNRFLEYAYVLLQKKNINFCYIGTAGNDRLIERLFFTGFMRAKFGKSVRTSNLLLVNNKLTPQQIEDHLSQQDMIFVGGGNTEKMLEIWESSGFTTILNKLRQENRLPILAGVSAGGMYPFHSGLSDVTPGQYKPLACLNWFPQSFCPHSDSEKEELCLYYDNQYLKRMDAYSAAIRSRTLPAGYAVPDDCMLHFYKNNLVCALSSRKQTNCYYVTPDKTETIVTRHLTGNSMLGSVRDIINVKEENATHERSAFRPECWRTLFQSVNVINYFISLFRDIKWA